MIDPSVYSVEYPGYASKKLYRSLFQSRQLLDQDLASRDWLYTNSARISTSHLSKTETIIK